MTCPLKTLNNKEYRCTFELALQVMGGKWKPIILYQLAQGGVLRFGQLRRTIPGITERMLTRQLRELEADQLIRRKVFREVPPRVEYSLLEPGVHLIPILLHMREWGENYERFMGMGEEKIGDRPGEKPDSSIAPQYLHLLESVRQTGDPAHTV